MVCAGVPVGAEGFRAEMHRAVDEVERNLPKTVPPATPPLPAGLLPPGPLGGIPQAAVPNDPPPPSAAGRLLPNPALQPVTSKPVAVAADDVEPILADPLETINRGLLVFNTFVMRHALDPLVDLHRRLLPPSVQRSVVNVFRNLREPVNLAAAILQWEWTDAQIILSRFVINTTLGIGGLVDQAAVLGFNPRIRTVDQAMCRWGMGTGPYVVLPLLGPSSLRDTVARTGVLVVQATVVGLWVIPYRVLDMLAQYTVTRDTWEALALDQPQGYDRLRAIYGLYTELPCTARNAVDNGLFFQ